MGPTMNEHGSQGQSTVGSELLLGMHGFVGGQSQNSGRAPGLQMQLSVSRGWRRIEVKGEDDGGAPRTKPPSGVRRSGAGVGGSVRDLGSGLGVIARVALTRKMFRTGGGRTMRGGQGSLWHSPGLR